MQFMGSEKNRQESARSWRAGSMTEQCALRLLKALMCVAGIVFLCLLSPVAAAEQPLKIGVASMITPVDAVKYYQDVIDYIGERIGRPVQMVHRRTYDEMVRAS